MNGPRPRKKILVLRYTLLILTAFHCSAIVYFSVGIAFTQAPLPNPGLTPGAVATTNRHEVCQIGYAKQHRAYVRASLRRRIFAKYGVPFAKRQLYEVDHLIPLAEGGSNDERNLWPQARNGRWTAKDKDRLERRLKMLVCSGRMNLTDAQRQIARNWIELYQRVFYHSRK